MTSKDNVEVLGKGVASWNQWRQENPSLKPDLSGVDLSGIDLCNANLSGLNLSHANLSNAKITRADLSYSDLSGADLSGAILSDAFLCYANLSAANLRNTKLEGANLNCANLVGANLGEAVLIEAYLNQADLSGAYLFQANLHHVDLYNAKLVHTDLRGITFVGANLANANFAGSDLRQSNFFGADLSGSDFSNADLSGSNLTATRMINVKLNGATLTNCAVFGVSAWGLIDSEKAEQSNLIITHDDEPVIVVDNLEVAQFIYLMLYSEKIRGVIETITSKAVLILGRFTPEHKGILDALRVELRKRNYLPILFDFDKPSSRDLTETISTLAHMSRFIIADITDAKCVPQELQRIVPNLPSVPVQPILLSSAKEYAMFEHFKRYPWVLKIYEYSDINSLLEALGEKVITPAEEKANELQKVVDLRES